MYAGNGVIGSYSLALGGGKYTPWTSDGCASIDRGVEALDPWSPVASSELRVPIKYLYESRVIKTAKAPLSFAMAFPILSASPPSITMSDTSSRGLKLAPKIWTLVPDASQMTVVGMW